MTMAFVVVSLTTDNNLPIVEIICGLVTLQISYLLVGIASDVVLERSRVKLDGREDGPQTRVVPNKETNNFC